MAESALQYERIKRFIQQGIDAGDWASGTRIPSENQLAAKFSLSRMTVNRAIKELEADGVVERVQGKGTFVAPPRPLKSVLQIQGIDDEIRARGNQYSCRVLSLKATSANQELSERLQLAKGSQVWASSIVHFENGVPLQLEQRWVKPSIWKDYLKQDFTRQTPHSFLMSQAPFTCGQHTIEARLPGARVRKILEMKDNEACLLIHRRTWVGEKVASYVQLFHPGSRFQITTSMNR